MKLSVAQVLSTIGRALIGAGLIILLFVAYQLWGTNIHEAQAQGQLRGQFDDSIGNIEESTQAALDKIKLTASTSSTALPAGDGTSSTTATAPPPTTAVPDEIVRLVYPQEGEPLAVIRIPKIGVKRVVVEGTEVEDLKRGPGHYTETPIPGQRGNVAIAGHRTTYGAPFQDIDKLTVGDEILITGVLGDAVYRVDKDPFIVQPTQVEVLDDYGDSRLTLTACHPKLSAAQRIVVVAKLVSTPLAEVPRGTSRTVKLTSSTLAAADTAATTTGVTTTSRGDAVTTSQGEGVTTSTTTDASGTSLITVPVPTTAAPDLQQGLAGDRSALAPAGGWALICAAIGVLAWYTGRRWQARRGIGRLRKFAVYALVSPVFLFFLYLCFTNVDRVLPAY